MLGQVLSSEDGVDLRFGGGGVLVAEGQDFNAEAAASFGPFVGLLGQHRADEADVTVQDVA